MNKSDFKLVGHFAVDAGICWIGDPCYILHKDSPYPGIGKNWYDFCGKLSKGHVTEFGFSDEDRGNGLGVCITTGYGDGYYPVYAKIEDGIVSGVFIDFNNNMEDDNG